MSEIARGRCADLCGLLLFPWSEYNASDASLFGKFPHANGIVPGMKYNERRHCMGPRIDMASCCDADLVRVKYSHAYNDTYGRYGNSSVCFSVSKATIEQLSKSMSKQRPQV